MAYDARHGFTVQEATNLQVYNNYSSVTITVDDDNTDNDGTNWLTSGDGAAKEVTFIPFSGDAAAVIKIWLKIAGSYGDAITVKFDDFPLTINGLLIDQIKIQSDTGSTGGTAEVFEVLSFH
jgi:hypothetical protein|tara:strand:+ start:425 stop:790 length:366 start_codon:yes stop_codon:yes gene_type:complete